MATTWTAVVPVFILAGITLLINPTDGAECGDPNNTSIQVAEVCYNVTTRLSSFSTAYMSLVSNSPKDECSCSVSTEASVTTEIVSPVGNTSCVAFVDIIFGTTNEAYTLNCGRKTTTVKTNKPHRLRFKKSNSDMCIKLTVEGSGNVSIICDGNPSSTPTGVPVTSSSVHSTQASVIPANTSVTESPNTTAVTTPVSAPDYGPKVVPEAVILGIFLTILIFLALIVFFWWRDKQRGPRRRAGSNYPAVEVQGVGDLR